MNIVLLTAHSIAEYDDFRMLTDLGYDVFSIGAYIDPYVPGDDVRPPFDFDSGVPVHVDLAELCRDQMRAKENLPDEVLDWADTIIVHHYPYQWLINAWPRIQHKRVIWRTCGQSDVPLEIAMSGMRQRGVQIVRYSPKEQSFFEERGVFAGQDALIRFGKYPEDWLPWAGGGPFVTNITQNMKGRGNWVGESWYTLATAGVAARPMGDGSEQYEGGLGKVSYETMNGVLRSARAYVYTGTHPASYTLGLIEAMMAGTPVVSIGPSAWMGPDGLFEAHEIAGTWEDDPAAARVKLQFLLQDYDWAKTQSDLVREKAIRLFGIETVGAQWKEFLG